MSFSSMTKSEVLALKKELDYRYQQFKAKELKLDMSRGKPGSDQIDLSMKLLDAVSSRDSYKTQAGFDARNYGVLDGIPEAKQLFADILEVSPDNVIVGGNSSLNMMFDVIANAMTHGFVENKPLMKEKKVKFLCPSPGYDRHFSICQYFGIEMITINMSSTGPDMDEVEQLVSTDDSIKGIWCVPKYSNPDGITYSDEVVTRFSKLKPAAQDFRIFWDNAYAVHDLTDTPDKLLNIIDLCKANGNENMPIVFTSTSKISFPGAGLAALATSIQNINHIKKRLFMQTIGPDKLNQLRHVRYFKNLEGIKAHMKLHAQILRPKFDIVLNMLQKELGDLGIAEWNNPNGGYFISVNTPTGCAKRVVELCSEAGVTLTPAGATFPLGNDPSDRNIRIAPTFPPIGELSMAMELFCICVKIAAIEKILTQ